MNNINNQDNLRNKKINNDFNNLKPVYNPKNLKIKRKILYKYKC
jgi:hypothetical protein